MQVPTIPPPLITNTLPQDVAAKAVPNLQATAPLIHNPVQPTPKSEKFDGVRRDKENPRRKADEDGDKAEEDDKQDDHSLNIRV